MKSSSIYQVGQSVVIISVVNCEPKLAVGPLTIKKITKKGIYLNWHTVSKKDKPFDLDGNLIAVNEDNYYYLLPYISY